MVKFGVVAHGGAGSPSEWADGCRSACERAYRLLGSGKPALDAVIEAACALEDDGRFNAGSGSVLRLDGKTREMDAAVMDSTGRIGIVIAIRHVKNPVAVAGAVLDTPHVALCGEGATIFAERKGFPVVREPSVQSLKQYEKMKRLIEERKVYELNPRWSAGDVEGLWNFPDVSYRETFSCDTIGVVALDQEGRFAVATSTGGASPMLLGRVGDSPMIGCGFYAGSAGAVAATGIGEEIIKSMLAKTVYDWIRAGQEPVAAAEKGVDLFPPAIPAGLIVLSRSGYVIASNRRMASSAVIKED